MREYGNKKEVRRKERFVDVREKYDYRIATTFR
jgi:hypothetical protein